MTGQKHFQVDYDTKNNQYKRMTLPANHQLQTMITS